MSRNLCWTLKNKQARKDKTHAGLTVKAIYEYDLDGLCSRPTFCSTRRVSMEPRKVYAGQLMVCQHFPKQLQ